MVNFNVIPFRIMYVPQWYLFLIKKKHSIIIIYPFLRRCLIHLTHIHCIIYVENQFYFFEKYGQQCKEILYFYRSWYQRHIFTGTVSKKSRGKNKYKYTHMFT